MIITITDIHDKLLNVTEQDITVANLFIEDLAGRMGVKPEEIRKPVPFLVKRLAIYYACYNRCLACVGTDATTTFDGGDRKDIYAQKLDFYKKGIDEIQAKLTQADFKGAVVGGSVISMWRA